MQNYANEDLHSICNINPTEYIFIITLNRLKNSRKSYKHFAYIYENMFGDTKTDKDRPSDILFKNILGTLANMQDADIASSQSTQEKFYKRTIWGLRLTMKGMDQEARKKVEYDIRNCEAQLAKLEEENENSLTLKAELDRLYVSFSKAHVFYVIDALSKIGIYKTFEDGEIDFSKTDMETLGKIVRADRGIAKSVDGVMNK